MFIFFFVNWVNIKYFNLRQTLRIDLLRNRGNTSVYMYLTAQIYEDDRRWMSSHTRGATFGLWFICETASVHCICIYISFASKYIRSENKSMTIKWPTCIVWNAKNSNCSTNLRTSRLGSRHRKHSGSTQQWRRLEHIFAQASMQATTPSSEASVSTRGSGLSLNSFTLTEPDQ